MLNWFKVNNQAIRKNYSIHPKLIMRKPKGRDQRCCDVFGFNKSSPLEKLSRKTVM